MRDEHYFSMKHLPSLPDVPDLPALPKTDSSHIDLLRKSLPKASNYNLHLGHNFTFNRFDNCVFHVNVYINGKEK